MYLLSKYWNSSLCCKINLFSVAQHLLFLLGICTVQNLIKYCTHCIAHFTDVLLGGLLYNTYNNNVKIIW